MDKLEAIRKLEDTVLEVNQTVYLFGDFPTSMDKSVFDDINSFDLADKFDANSHPRLFSWFSLIGEFTPVLTMGWSDPKLSNPQSKELLDLLKVIQNTIREESEKEAEARREKARLQNYIAPEDKRPADEYYDVGSIELEAMRVEDISDGQDGSFLKYIMTETTSQFDRKIE
mmetsp:Transcript_34646/g.53005  ORF Transcript_34646/g.53005 Transcript_34646/m.53005 type:complete len:172 (-) Transcript_34646:1026-1541(-)